VRTILGMGLATIAIIPSLLNAAECSVTISAFDPQGAPVAISYLDLTIADDPSESLRSVVLVKRDEKHPNSYTLELPKEIPKVHFNVRSRLSNGEIRVDRVVLLTCNDSFSVVVGRDYGTDHTSITRVSGQLVKCACNSELWIRAFPMFGGTFEPSFSEAIVEQETCKFDMAIPNRGVRYIFVVGKGNQSLGTFDRNMVGSGVNQLGKVLTSPKLCR